MAIPFFGRKAREARTQKREVATVKVKSSRKLFAARLQPYQEARKQHQTVVAKNTKALNERPIESIPGSERVFLPGQTREEIMMENNTKAKRVEAASGLRTARKVRKEATTE